MLETSRMEGHRTDKLHPDNCFLLVVHPHPLGRIIRGEKFEEYRGTNVHRRHLLLCSPMATNSGSPYGCDASIRPNRVYAVAYVAHTKPCTADGKPAQWTWKLDPILILHDPVLIGAPVGQKQQAPRPEHLPALRLVNEGIKCTAYECWMGPLHTQTTQKIVIYIYIYI